MKFIKGCKLRKLVSRPSAKLRKSQKSHIGTDGCQETKKHKTVGFSEKLLHEYCPKARVKKIDKQEGSHDNRRSMNNQLKPSKVLGRGDVSLKHENYGLLCQKFAMKHSQKNPKC